jgi:hypothetical protein
MWPLSQGDPDMPFRLKFTLLILQGSAQEAMEITRSFATPLELAQEMARFATLHSGARTAAQEMTGYPETGVLDLPPKPGGYPSDTWVIIKKVEEG